MNEQASIGECGVCGIDVVDDRCGCSNFERVDKRRSKVYWRGQCFYVAEDPRALDAPRLSLLRQITYVGVVWVDGCPVPVLADAVAEGKRLATYSRQSGIFSLRDPSDPWAEGEGSTQADQVGSEVHQASVRDAAGGLEVLD